MESGLCVEGEKLEGIDKYEEMIGMGIILIVVLGTIGIIGLNEKEVTRVTKNGIVATIEDVRKDFTRAIIKVNLQKEDGGALRKIQE